MQILLICNMIMAVVIPYKDRQAHGKLNNSLCFRRRLGTVILGSLPVSKKICTPKQKEQRDKMIISKRGYGLLPFETRKYIYWRSKELRMNPNALYLQAYLLDQLPSNVPAIPMKIVNDMVIIKTVSNLDQGCSFSIFNSAETFNCVCWNKMEAAVSGKVPSEIGPDGDIKGELQFDWAKFNNGVCYVIPSHGYYADLIKFGLFPLQDEGIVEAWVRLTFPIVNGQPSPSGNFPIFDIYPGIPRGYIRCLFDDGQGLHCNYTGTTGSLWMKDTISDFDPNTKHHILLAWSRSESLPDGKTFALYVDGSRTISSAQPLPPNDRGIEITALARIYQDLEGYVDNIKFYPGVNHLAGIIANKDNENFPGSIEYGRVYDQENQYIFKNEVSVQALQFLKIKCNNPEGIEIPFRYPISIHWTDNDDQDHVNIVRLPKLYLAEEEEKTFWLSQDFTLYNDQSLWRIAATDKF